MSRAGGAGEGQGMIHRKGTRAANYSMSGYFTWLFTVTDLGGRKMSLFSCSFRENWSNSRLLPPPSGWCPSFGNPGSATGFT